MVVMQWTRSCADRLRCATMIAESDATIAPQETSPMKPELHVLGSDIAQRVHHALGLEDRGPVVERQRVSRQALRPLIAQRPPIRIGSAASARLATQGSAGPPMRPAVRPVTYKRQPRGRGQRGSGDAADPTLWAGPGRRPAGYPSAPARARAAHKRADGPGACSARAAARVGDCAAQRGAKLRQAVVGKLASAQDKCTPLSPEMGWQLVEELATLAEQLAYDQATRAALATTWSAAATTVQPGPGRTSMPGLAGRCGRPTQTIRGPRAQENRHAWQVPHTGRRHVWKQSVDVTDRSRSPAAPCAV